jgi:hypothetical protein
MIEQGPRRPYLHVVIGVLVVAAAVIFVATRGGHRAHRVTAPKSRLAAPIRAVPQLPRQLSGGPIQARANLAVGGDALAEIGLPHGELRRVGGPSGTRTVQLLGRRDGVAALVSNGCTSCPGSVVFLGRHSTEQRIGAAGAIVGDVATDRIWLVNQSRSGDLRSTNVTLVDERGRVIRGPRDIDLDTVFHGTELGLLGYSGNSHAIELWNPDSGKMRLVAPTATHPALLDATNSAAAWTDFSVDCYDHCIHVAHIGKSVHIDTFELPANTVLALQPRPGAMSPDGSRIAFLTTRTGTGAVEIEGHGIMVADARTHHLSDVPGTPLSPDSSDVRLSLAWSPDSTVLWIGDSDDQDGKPLQIARWSPGRRSLQIASTTATHISAIAQLPD